MSQGINSLEPKQSIDTTEKFLPNPSQSRIRCQQSGFKITAENHKAASLVRRYNRLQQVVSERTKSGFSNFLYNLFHPKRKKNLENLKTALDDLNVKQNTTFRKEQIKDKLTDLVSVVFCKPLPKDVADCFDELLDEAKEEKIEVRVPEKDLKFEGKTELGKGSFGTIYKSDDGHFVIKKAIEDKVLNGDDTAECKRNEAVESGLRKMMASKEYFYSQNRNFVTRYVGSMSDSFQQYPVFEYIEGNDLHKCIHGEKQSDEKMVYPEKDGKRITFSMLQKVQLLSQMASGIAALHEAGCVNRDIKPANTMVYEKDGSWSVKLVDQGLTLDIKKQQGEIDPGGTHIYQLPTENEKPSVSPACDVFSLGMSIAELMTGGYTNLQVLLDDGRNGKRTLNEATWNQALEELKLDPPFIKDLVKACCAYNPEARPSAAQVAYCLEVFSSYKESEDAKKDAEPRGKPGFSDILQQAQRDRPKSIPVTMRQLLQSDKPKEVQQGCAAILQLGKADASYQATPSYGLALLRSGKKDEFNAWVAQRKEDLQNIKSEHANLGNLQNKINALKDEIAALHEVHKVLSSNGSEAERASVKKRLDEKIKQSNTLKTLEESLNQNPLYNLNGRITTEDVAEDGAVWGSKDIKVSQEEYRIISEALQDKSEAV